MRVGGCAGEQSLAVEAKDVAAPEIVVGPLPPGGGRPLRFDDTETGEVHVICR
jgi:hypothetical protein